MKRSLLIWLIYMAVLACIAGFFLFKLRGILVDYQAKADSEAAAEAYARQSARAPQMAAEHYAAQMNAAWWAVQYTTKNGADDVDTPEQIQRYFTERLAEHPVKLYRAADWTEQQPVYAAWAGEDGDVRARLALSGNGTDWSVTDVTLSVAGHCGGETEVPSGCEVYCNNALLDESHASPVEDERFPFPEYKEALVNPVTWKTYSVSDLLCEPELRSVTPEDRIIEHSETDGFDVYRMEGGSAPQIMNRADSFLRAYLALISGGDEGMDGRMSACLSMVRHDSPAYQLLSSSRWSIASSMDYTNLRIDILSADAPIIWSDNACTADICYHAYAKYQGVERDYSVEDQRLRILFIDQGAGYEICAFQIL